MEPITLTSSSVRAASGRRASAAVRSAVTSSRGVEAAACGAAARASRARPPRPGLAQTPADACGIGSGCCCTRRGGASVVSLGRSAAALLCGRAAPFPTHRERALNKNKTLARAPNVNVEGTHGWMSHYVTGGQYQLRGSSASALRRPRRGVHCAQPAAAPLRARGTARPVVSDESGWRRSRETELFSVIARSISHCAQFTIVGSPASVC